MRFENRIKFLIVLISLTTNVFGSEYSAYEKKLLNYSNHESEYNISLENMPPIENQKNLGFCYAFSARTLLEQYHCKELAMNCNSLVDKDKFSVLDIASYNFYSPEYLNEGGRIDKVFKSIKRLSSHQKISSEECASYSKLDYSYSTGIIAGKKTRASITYKTSKGGWEYLKSQYLKYKNASYNKQEELLDDTQINLRLELDNAQLLEAFTTTKGIQSFYFKSLIPEHCRDNSYSRDVLDYKIGKFPQDKEDKPSHLELTTKMYQLLKNNTAFNVSFCAIKTMNAQTGKLDCTYHGAVIKGIKKVCSKSGFCELMVQFHNSYGEKWQKKYSDGWVRLNPLLDSLWPDVKFNWLEATTGSLLDLNYREISWIRSTFTKTYRSKKVRKNKVKTHKNTSDEFDKQTRKNVVYQCGSRFVSRKIDDSCVIRNY